MKKKYINPTAQAIQLEINPPLCDVQSYEEQPGETVTGGKGHSISNDGPEYDEEL
jgi:hypothetical protein